MCDVFAPGAAVLAHSFRAQAAHPITITNRQTGATLRIETTATIGSSQFEETSQEGAIVQIRTRDFVVERAALIDDDQEKVLPARGWIVTEEDGTQYETYAPTGLMPWRWSDRSNQKVRIHTRDF